MLLDETRDDTAPAPVTTEGLLCEIRDALHLVLLGRATPRRLVDISDSESSATTLTLRGVQSAVCLIDTIIYSCSAAATLTLGTRAIPLQTGTNSLRVGQLVLYPYDRVTLALSGVSPTPGPLFLEIVGEQVGVGEHLEVIR